MKSLSNLAHFRARIPQILKNRRKRSCEGEIVWLWIVYTCFVMKISRPVSPILHFVATW